jgi:hypothetical protein
MCSSGSSMWSQQKGERHVLSCTSILCAYPAASILVPVKSAVLCSVRCTPHPAVCSQHLSPVCLCCRYSRLCRVQLGAGGMDALIRLGCGDMRRTLNILQVRHAQHLRFDASSSGTDCHNVDCWTAIHSQICCPQCCGLAATVPVMSLQHR